MPSYNSDLFNTDPYYDDFNEDKKFMKIVFRPGYGVQARELSQIQTIIQNQIERFGNGIYEEASIVTGGKINVNSLKFARVENLVGTNSIDDFVGVFIGASAAPGSPKARARIVHAETGLTTSSLDNFNVIYFDYIEGGTGFTDGDIIGGTASDGVTYLTASVTGYWTGSGPYPVGDALVVSVDEGVRFVDGFFTFHESQSLGAYSLTGSVGSEIRQFSQPTTSVGFSVDKSFVTSDDDTSLNDPAYGSYNYNAPGADRYKIDLVLSQRGYTATETSAVDNFSRTDFVEFIRLVNGSPIKIEKYPDYAGLEDTLARRTYDESGNYTVRPFEINLSNGGGLTDGNINATLNVDLEPGKAYVFGYEFETQGSVRLGLSAPRGNDSVRSVSDVRIPRGVGPYCEVEFSGITASLTGFLGFPREQLVYLSNNQYPNSLNRIGTARIRAIDHQGGLIYNLGMYDIEMSGTASFDDVTRIFVDSTGPSHAFSVTGSGLLFTQNSNLLYEIPSGIRCKQFNDADYAVSYHKEMTLGPIPPTGITAITVNTASYSLSYNDVFFSIPSGDIANIPSENITVFDAMGPISGTAALGANDNELLVTLQGRGVTQGNKIWISASMDVDGIAYPDSRRRKTLAVADITGGAGSTGLYAGMTTDSYGNNLYYLGGLVDVVEVLSLTGYKGNSYEQIKSHFIFDNGQRDNLYDWSRMVMIAGTTGMSANGAFAATVRYYSRNTAERGPFTVDSYTDTGIAYSDIPDYTSRTTGKKYNLADVIDFRPDKTSDGNVTHYPWIPVNVAANDNQFSYDHYLSRTDKIVLTRDRTFNVVKGTPSLDGIIPADDPNAMTLYTVTLNPYTYDKDDVSVRYIDNRRYTMRDIGDLEKRIEAVEYYTTLSLLEQQAKTLSIVDSNGIEMPKKGILVDQFKGHNIADTNNPMFAASIDFEKNELRPPFEYRVFGLSGQTYTSGITASGDGIVTLDYSVKNEIVQPLATTSVKINPAGIVNYIGTISISPPGDFWFDTGITASIRVNVDGENDGWQTTRGFGSQWNDWESIWYGREVQSEKTTKPNVINLDTIMGSARSINLDTSFKTGVPEGIKRKSNSRVTRKDVVPYIRNKTLTITAKGLKPSTTYYVFLDGVNITNKCTFGSQSTNSKGETPIITYNMANDTTNEFLTGRRVFRITDSSTNTASEATMSADGVYHVTGYIDTLSEDGILSTRSASIRRKTPKSNKVQSNLTELLSTDFFGFTEPLSQTFFVDPVKYPDGIFVKNVGVAFAQTSTNPDIPVTLMLKPTTSGYPHPSKVMPFGEVTVYTGAIGTSTDASNITTFTFTSPIYLLPGYEYAISLATNSSDVRVYKSVVGENIINTDPNDPDRRASKQPAIRSLFTAQNTGALKKSDIESIKFRIGVCSFSPKNGYVEYNNSNETYTTSTKFDAGRINVNYITPSNTTATFSDSGLISNSGFVQFLPNKNFDRAANTSANRVFNPLNTTLKMNFVGTEYASPAVDLKYSHYLVVHNKVNDASTLAENNELLAFNYGATAPSEARYITKQVILEEGFEATNIHVQMSLCNPYLSWVQVFVRPLPLGQNEFENVGYTQLTSSDVGTGLSTNTGYSQNNEAFREVTFSASDLPLFRAFTVKIVMYSESATQAGNDPRSLPRIKNLRIVAT